MLDNVLLSAARLLWAFLFQDRRPLVLLIHLPDLTDRQFVGAALRLALDDPARGLVGKVFGTCLADACHDAGIGAVVVSELLRARIDTATDFRQQNVARNGARLVRLSHVSAADLHADEAPARFASGIVCLGASPD